MRTVLELPAGVVVLAVEPHTFPVHSDNAMLDSGEGFLVHTWDGTRAGVVPVNNGRTSEPLDPPAVNATDEHRYLAKAYSLARQFITNAHKCAERAHYLGHGVKVRVVRGRKVPKGEYEVTKHGNGGYNPWVHLRDASGRFFNYCNVANVEVVPDYVEAFAGFAGDADERAVLAKVAAEKFNAFAWGVFADFIETRERITSVASVRPADFANAVRNVMAEELAPRFSTYHADCHNEFRRPFAGV